MKRTLLGLGLILCLSGQYAHARLIIDYEGKGGQPLKMDDPLVKVDKIPVKAAKPAKTVKKVAVANSKSDRGILATVMPVFFDEEPVKEVSASGVTVPIQEAAAIPAKSTVPAAEKRGVTSVGSRYRLARTSSGECLTLPQAMLLVTPRGWTFGYKGNMPKTDTISWDVKKADLPDVLSLLHDKAGVSFTIDWKKKNIEVRK